MVSGNIELDQNNFNHILIEPQINFLENIGNIRMIKVNDQVNIRCKRNNHNFDGTNDLLNQNKSSSNPKEDHSTKRNKQWYQNDYYLVYSISSSLIIRINL